MAGVPEEAGRLATGWRVQLQELRLRGAVRCARFAGEKMCQLAPFDAFVYFFAVLGEDSVDLIGPCGENVCCLKEKLLQWL